MAKKVFAENKREIAQARERAEKAKREAEEAERLAAEKAFREILRKQEQGACASPATQCRLQRTQLFSARTRASIYPGVHLSSLPRGVHKVGST